MAELNAGSIRKPTDTTPHHHYLTLRSAPLEYLGVYSGRVSKGGQHHDWSPSFETHRFAMLLRMRLAVID
jgi:hypothetical protein